MPSTVMEAKSNNIMVNLAGHGNKQDRKDALREHVKHAVEGLLGVGVDLVAGFGEAPGDWVKEKKEELIGGEHGEGSADVLPKSDGKATADNEDLPDEEEVREDAESEEAPLIVGGDEGANEMVDGKGPDKQDSEEDASPTYTSEELKSPDDQREIKRISDPARVEDLAGKAGVAVVAGGDDGGAEVGGQDEVVDGRDEEDSDREVVEDAAAERSYHCPAEDGEEEEGV